MKNLKEKFIDLPVALNVNDNLDELHHHDELEIIFVLNGTAQLLVHNKTYNIKKGDLRIINFDNVHRLKPDGKDFKYLSLYFHMPYFNQFIPDIGYTFFQCAPNEKLGGKTESYLADLKESYFNIIKYYFDEDIFNSDINRQYINQQAILILTNLRNWFPLYNSRIKEDFSEEQLDKLWVIMEYIYDNCERKLTIKEIADYVYLSPNYLSHYIKKVTGTSYKELLNFIRSENALKMLIGTDKSITRISQECGFSEPKYFKKYFELYYNVSPKQYRNEYGKDKFEKTSSMFKEITFDNSSEEDLELIRKNIQKYASRKNSVHKLKENLLVDLDAHETYSIDKEKSIYLDDYEDLYSIRNQKIIRESVDKLGICEICLTATKKISKKDRFLMEDIAESLECRLIIEPTKKSNEKTALFCSAQNKTKGLFTKQGIKTPYFYYRQFCSMLNEVILMKADNYMISGNKEEIQILVNDFFNKKKGGFVNKDTIIGIKGLIKSNYDRIDFIIDHCSEFYDELDKFESVYKRLSHRESGIVNEMNMPDVLFDTISPKSTIYKMAVPETHNSIRFITLKLIDDSAHM